MMIPLIRHIPHCSTKIPAQYREPFLLSGDELDRERLRMTDWYTDEIFDGDLPGSLVFPLSRLLVDVERFENDGEEVMASRGMGVLYTRTHELQPLRRELTPEEREELLSRYYRPHHAKLEALVDDALETSGQVLVIDCHSFPSRRLPYEMAAVEDPRPEICIGTDPFHTPGWLREAAREEFSRAGFSVEVDTPFSGALTPAKHYRREKKIHALMIEVRRDLYMNEETGERSGQFGEVKNAVQEVIEELEKALDDHRSTSAIHEDSDVRDHPAHHKRND